MSATHPQAPAGPQPAELPGFPGAPECSAAELLSDCRRMAPGWTSAPHAAPEAPVPPSSIHGTRVSEASAHAVDAMPDYGC